MYPAGNRSLRRRRLAVTLLALGMGLYFLPSRPLTNASRVGVVEQAQAQADIGIAGGLPASSVNLNANAAIDQHAQGNNTLTPSLARFVAPFVELGAMDSVAGETRETFLVRVAQTMDLFTRTTRHEACGVLMESHDKARYRVRLTSNLSHISCVKVQFDEPGYGRVGPDIHSHPRIPGGVEANAQDVARRRDFSCGQRIFVFDETFSSVDFQQGAGYLVTRGQLLYQHGRQWPIQQIASFDPIDTYPALALGGQEVAFEAALASAAMRGDSHEGLPNTRCDTPAPANHPPGIDNTAVTP